jgi:hypothetical protein
MGTVMAKSHELRQGTSWEKAKYEVGDGKKIVTSKSELRGDSTPKKIGHHASAKGRKAPAANGATQTAAILDRNPAKSIKPWANAPAEAVMTHDHPHWTKAVDAGAHPPNISDVRKGSNVGSQHNGQAHSEADIVTKSGDHNWCDPSCGNMGSAGWKTKNYPTDTPGELPEGELKKKWSK